MAGLPKPMRHNVHSIVLRCGKRELDLLDIIDFKVQRAVPGGRASGYIRRAMASGPPGYEHPTGGLPVFGNKGATLEVDYIDESGTRIATLRLLGFKMTSWEHWYTKSAPELTSEFKIRWRADGWTWAWHGMPAEPGPVKEGAAQDALRAHVCPDAARLAGWMSWFWRNRSVVPSALPIVNINRLPLPEGVRIQLYEHPAEGLEGTTCGVILERNPLRVNYRITKDASGFEKRTVLFIYGYDGMRLWEGDVSGRGHWSERAEPSQWEPAIAQLVHHLDAYGTEHGIDPARDMAGGEEEAR